MQRRPSAIEIVGAQKKPCYQKTPKVTPIATRKNPQSFWLLYQKKTIYYAPQKTNCYKKNLDPTSA